MRLSSDQLAFVTERHLATLTTPRGDGSAHVVPVAFTWDEAADRARITTRVTSVKARNVLRGGDAGVRAVLCQLDGRRWLTLEGDLTVSRDPDEVASAVRAYAGRYRELAFQPERVVMHLAVDRLMGSVR